MPQFIFVGMYSPVAETLKINTKTPQCDHCGDPCIDASITGNDKVFCCEGCKTVYSILNDYDLNNFYQLNKNAGLSQKNKSKLEYIYLDDSDVFKKLIDFTNHEITKVHFYLPQVHCSSCLWLLENIHQINSGINQSRVDFLQKEVSITFRHNEISLRQVVELLDMIGYPPTIQLNDLDTKSKSVIDRSLYYKLGLAGFAFGNIMLFSFPEYLGLDQSDQQFQHFFGYLNILIILPVILYSGSDYLRNAWQGLRQRHLSIDVPISLGILALFFRSAFEILSQTGAGYLDSLAGLIFFLLIGKWFQQNTYAKISFDRDYKSYFPIAAKVKTGEIETQVTLDKLKKGDLLVIRHGELIPADGSLISNEAQIDYSFVTGEADLINSFKGDQVYAGGRQMGGLIEVAVAKKVSNSYLTQLWNHHSFTKSAKEGQVSSLANRIASLFTIAILLIAFATLFYWLPIDTKKAVNAFTAVLIIACPCAVALSIPFTFGNVLRLFAKSGIYLKNVQVIESLSKIRHIVFDKTGTITNTLRSIIRYEGKPLSQQEIQGIKSLTDQSTHPISQQIAGLYSLVNILDVQEFIERKGVGISGYVNQIFIEIKAHNNQTHVFINGEKKGVFIQKSEYRLGLKKALKALSANMHISLLSGDNNLEQAFLQKSFSEFDQLYFNQRPEEKLEHIRNIQKTGEHVAMVGDGLNDAGALQQSNVGIVITQNTANFTPACDLIIDATKFEKIPLLFSLSRQSIRIVYITYFMAALYNVVGLSFAIQGALSPIIAAILMPLSSVSIVIFGVFMSTICVKRAGLD